MCVKFAVQVLSHTVAAGTGTSQLLSEARYTSKFIDKVDTMFEFTVRFLLPLYATHYALCGCSFQKLLSAATSYSESKFNSMASCRRNCLQGSFVSYL